MGWAAAMSYHPAHYTRVGWRTGHRMVATGRTTLSYPLQTLVASSLLEGETGLSCTQTAHCTGSTAHTPFPIDSFFHQRIPQALSNNLQ